MRRISFGDNPSGQFIGAIDMSKCGLFEITALGIELAGIKHGLHGGKIARPEDLVEVLWQCLALAGHGRSFL